MKTPKKKQENMKHTIVLLGVGIMLFGCAHHQPETFWVRPGSTEQEFNADKYECMKEVTAMLGQQSYMAFGEVGFVIASTEIARRRANATAITIFDACMQSKGWMKQQPVEKQPNEETRPWRSTGRRFVGDGIDPPYPPHLQKGCYWLLDKSNWKGNTPPRDLWEWEEQCK